MNRVRLFRLELRRLFRSRLTWLVMLLSLIHISNRRQRFGALSGEDHFKPARRCRRNIEHLSLIHILQLNAV